MLHLQHDMKLTSILIQKNVGRWISYCDSWGSTASTESGDGDSLVLAFVSGTLIIRQQKVRAIASSSWLCHVFYSLLSPLLIIFIQRRETGPSTISIPLTPLFTHEPSSELNHNLAFRPLTRVHHFKYGRKSSPLIETALFPHKFDVYFN